LQPPLYPLLKEGGCKGRSSEGEKGEESLRKIPQRIKIIL